MLFYSFVKLVDIVVTDIKIESDGVQVFLFFPRFGLDQKIFYLQQYDVVFSNCAAEKTNLVNFCIQSWQTFNYSLLLALFGY